MLWRGKMVSGACLAIAVATAIGWRAGLRRRATPSSANESETAPPSLSRHRPRSDMPRFALPSDVRASIDQGRDEGLEEHPLVKKMSSEPHPRWGELYEARAIETCACRDEDYVTRVARIDTMLVH